MGNGDVGKVRWNRPGHVTAVGGIIHSPLFDHIREYLLVGDSGKNTTFLFVPYVQADVAGRLLEGIRNRVVVVTTWNPQDIRSGSSDLDLYQLCRGRGYALYVSQNLHLKVYSVGLEGAVLATGNVSHAGLMPGGNHEAAIPVGRLTPANRLFLEGIRRDARLVDDGMYNALKRWAEENKMKPLAMPAIDDIVPMVGRDEFLVSALPMTRRIDDLVAGYERIAAGKEPSEDQETAACIFHDLANYGIDQGLAKEGFLRELSIRFFAHPFVKRIDEFIAPEAYFGRIKEWIQDNCTDVPIPSRRELTGNVQILLEWFAVLGGGRYVVDVPGARSQRIRRAVP